MVDFRIIVKSENMFTLHTLVGAGLPSPYARECASNYEIYYNRTLCVGSVFLLEGFPRGMQVAFGRVRRKTEPTGG